MPPETYTAANAKWVVGTGKVIVGVVIALREGDVRQGNARAMALIGIIA